MQNLEMAGAVANGEIALETAVKWNLAYNHFPPVSQDFVPVALRAIELGNDEEWDTAIVMPNGLTRSVGEIVDGLHLHAYITYEEE